MHLLSQTSMLAAFALLFACLACCPLRMHAKTSKAEASPDSSCAQELACAREQIMEMSDTPTALSAVVLPRVEEGSVR